MKALSAFLLVLAVCVAAVTPSSAASDNQLKNIRGVVTYQQGSSAPQPVALDANVALSDGDFAITGANSQAAITLPDSSRVLVGQDTRVQMKSFSQSPGIATANFVLVNGKTRFKVEHPSGAKANYTFTTSTGQIAVRGTEGDIAVSDTQLQVNVYQLGDPNLPVQVNLNNGKSYTLGAGQALVVGITGAVIASAAVSAVTQPLTSTFSEFGSPGSSTAAAAAVGAAAAANVAPAAIAAGAAAAVVAGVAVGSSHSGAIKSSSPPPNPTPTPTTNPTASPGALGVSPSTLTFGSTGQTLPLTVKQPHYHGTFTFTDSSVSVTPSQTSPDVYNVTSLTAGNSTLTVGGAPGTASKPVSISIASGNVVVTPSSATLSQAQPSMPFTVKEQAYTGAFTVNVTDPSVVSITPAAGSGNGTYTATGGSKAGTTTVTFTDAASHTGQLTVRAATAGITSLPTSVTLNAANPTATIQPVETGANFTVTSTGSVSVSPGKGSSGTTFTISSSALGHATAVRSRRDTTLSGTVTVDDGINPKSVINVTVVETATPSPQPSTTCVPIIIHSRRHEPEAASTSCPTATPAPAAPAPRGTAAAPRPHPVGPPAPVVATPQPVRTEKPKSPAPRQTPPFKLPQPGSPGGNVPPGMVTPPPMPGPPGGGR